MAGLVPAMTNFVVIARSVSDEAIQTLERRLDCFVCNDEKLRLIRLHRHAQRLRDRPGAAAGDEGDFHIGFQQQDRAAPDLLMQCDRGAAHLERPGDDIEQIVHMRGPQEFELHRPHHESEAGRFGLGFGEQRALVGTEQPQIVGATALHETQVVRVIDDAGELWLANIATQRLDSIGALEGYSVNKRRFSTLLP